MRGLVSCCNCRARDSFSSVQGHLFLYDLLDEELLLLLVRVVDAELLQSIFQSKGLKPVYVKN